MKKGNIIVGLDLSLCNSGLVALKGDKIIKQVNIKSKPIGENFPVDELIRIITIVEKIKEELTPLKKI